MKYFDPQPAAAELPVRLASPFAPGPPHPLARRAAEELQQLILGGTLGLGALDEPGHGKMFGVLAVATPEGRIGYLQGFSGMLGERWLVEGFVPPLFDAAARDAFWPAGEAELDALEAQHTELTRSPESTAVRASLSQLERYRAELSRKLWRQMAYSYFIPNARGEQQPLGALFEPAPPPGGAGDCAAPKLFAYAYRHHLRPLALAEFWWGAPPLTGERHAGEYYPACQSKCGVVLPYMLEGLSVEPAPLPAEGAGPDGALRVVHEDAWLLAVDKPCGLRCVPGRHSPLRDSVLVRLQRRYPEPPGLLVLHPLEAEASGLVLVARDEETHAALQRQFSLGEALKRYTAWLTEPVEGSQGTVEVPLGGKRALTEWQVTQRSERGTRVSLVPRTARTHQLRAHAAHPLGLGSPIAGDRLNGAPGPRLLLHAESVRLIHPRTGEQLTLECPATF